MTKRFSRMILAGLLPLIGVGSGCTELGEFDPQTGFGGATSSSSSAASGGSGGGGCAVLETDCSGSCAILDSDPLHCGACGHSCQGGDCLASTCLPRVLAASPYILDMALDATTIYWTSNDGSVRNVSKDGGEVVKIYDGVSYFVRIAVNATTIFLVYSNTDEIVKLPIGGGSLGQVAPGPGDVRVMLMDSLFLYWTNAQNRTVNKVPIDGGFQTTLVTSPMAPVDYSPVAMSLQGSTIYYTENSGNTDDPTDLVKKVSIFGGSSETLATGQWFPFHITALGPNVYWMNLGAGGSVNTVPIGGGEPVTLIQGLGGSLIDMAIDDSGIYWALDDGNNHGKVMTVPLVGGEAATLTSLRHDPTNILLDATSIYWSERDPVTGGGLVMKMAK